MRRVAVAAALVVVCAGSHALAQTTFTRQQRGNASATFNQVTCGAAGTTLVAADRSPDTTAGVATYDRLSIMIKNCDGANPVYICPGTAAGSCTTGTGFKLSINEGLVLDWSNKGTISCRTTGGLTAVVCYIEERG